MDLQFNQSVLRCLDRTASEYQSQEQTQEVRIPEDLPDVGTVLACWGQVILRGKEWRSDVVGITGGVMCKVLYMPDRGETPQCVDAWLPFQMKWNIPAGKQDGTLVVLPALRSADARALSSRKLMVRTNVGVQMQAFVPAEYGLYQPENVPEDVQLLRKSCKLKVPGEAGEKAFSLEENLEMNASEPKPEQVIHICMTPQVLEKKVLADKLIFRGLCIVHILYRAGDGHLYSRDFDVTFSQYEELSREFEPEAAVSLEPVVTNLELEDTPEGIFRLRAGLSGQYVIYDVVSADVTTDAYSPLRTVEPMWQPLAVPGIRDQDVQTVTAQADPGVDVMRPVDVAFWADPPYISREGALVEADLSGTFGLLYYDPEGQLQYANSRWEHQMQYPHGEEMRLHLSVRPGGKAQFGAGMLCADLQVESDCVSNQPQQMICGMDLGQPTEPDPQRPSLVVTRAGACSLWQLAKNHSSTVEHIMKANDLQGEPSCEQILLIPTL